MADKQTDICVCGHSRAAHFEEPPNACSLGDCLCEGFEKVDPLTAAAPDMLKALQCAETVLILLKEEVGRLGCNAKDVLPKVQAAIRKAEADHV